MAQDYENIDNIGDMSDGELRAFVRDRLEEQLAFDPQDIEVAVRNGVVRLSGRVGTESEYRIVEHVVTDVLGLSEVNNELVIDSIGRAESPVAIDDAELFGTADVLKAIEGGIPWNPPDSPTPEGLSGTDANPGVLSDDH
ncbi:MAG: BON domain-containing protein [Gemmatimonadaceae bacterium]